MTNGTMMQWHSDGNKKDQCTICGQLYDSSQLGEWISKGEAITSCHKCAVNDLPRLIADSILCTQVESLYARATQFFVEIEKQYWKAIACRAANERGSYD